MAPEILEEETHLNQTIIFRSNLLVFGGWGHPNVLGAVFKPTFQAIQDDRFQLLSSDKNLILSSVQFTLVGCFIYGDCNEPLYGSIRTSQCFMECHKGLFHAAHLETAFDICFTFLLDHRITTAQQYSLMV